MNDLQLNCNCFLNHPLVLQAGPAWTKAYTARPLPPGGQKSISFYPAVKNPLYRLSHIRRRMTGPCREMHEKERELCRRKIPGRCSRSRYKKAPLVLRFHSDGCTRKRLPDHSLVRQPLLRREAHGSARAFPNDISCILFYCRRPHRRIRHCLIRGSGRIGIRHRPLRQTLSFPCPVRAYSGA